MRNAIKRYSNEDVLKISLAGLMLAFVGDDSRFSGDVVHGACSFTNQVIASGKMDASKAWDKVAKIVNKKHTTATALVINAGNMVIASPDFGASRKTFIADILLTWAGLKR
jgi:hypothetical protein